jgi:hypothetical protein
MTEPFSMFDDLVPDVEPANLPGHPDGPGIVTLSVEWLVYSGNSLRGTHNWTTSWSQTDAALRQPELI